MKGLLPFYRFADFSGRSGRAEFWQFWLLALIAIIVAFALDTAMGNAELPLLTIGVICVGIVPSYSVSARRLHDCNVSAKWLIVQAVVGVLSAALWSRAGANIYTATGDLLLSLARMSDWVVRAFAFGMLGLCTLRGTQGPNRFGPPPLADEPAPTFRDVADRASSALTATRATPFAAPKTLDPLDQIERLAKLRDAGALTEEEFATRKAAYLDQL